MERVEISKREHESLAHYLHRHALTLHVKQVASGGYESSLIMNDGKKMQHCRVSCIILDSAYEEDATGYGGNPRDSIVCLIDRLNWRTPFIQTRRWFKVTKKTFPSVGIIDPPTAEELGT